MIDNIFSMVSISTILKRILKEIAADVIADQLDRFNKYDPEEDTERSSHRSV